ncbi:MAG: redox-sensing transcriptional repressor rex [Peptococcaceae bacterium BICA1-7]|nr:MAG: redox-sensing transcriptional repressor rex [Peptococcaceae bacterium BICA1-7]HBV96811.1 redox-sensing transcriptional repressor Rex [Desulfotomaculum sp.]
MKTLRVPEATVTRLSIYSRYLERLDRNGVSSVSSGEIADGVGVSPAQVRKDLAYFGEFGTRGVGYNVKDLMRYTLKILGLDRHWNLILVGAGNLGYALCTYRGFNMRGFSIVGVFDNDLTKIGKRINDLEVLPMESMPEIVKDHNVRIGIIATPTRAAQEVADYMIKCGMQAILNFAPLPLNLPEHVEVRNVDLSVKLEILTFNLGFKSAQNV